VVILRPTADPDLRHLRHRHVFEAACRAIPGLSTWVDPDRARPLTDVLPGGELINYYRGQRGRDGRPTVPGLICVGDSVCTTTPNFGRGVALSLMQADQFLTLFDSSDDVSAVASEFDAWTEANMRPWVEDHVWMDEAQGRRWHGEDVDLSRRLPSDLILAAAEQDPTIAPETGGYLAMVAGPSSLDGVEPLAHAVYAAGWRPAPAPGPTRNELAALIRHEMAS